MQRKWPNAFCIVVILIPATLSAAERLPGTNPLTLPNNLVSVHRQQVDGYFQQRIEKAKDIRDRLWKPDFASGEAYEKSVAPHRANCCKMLGLTDEQAKTDQAKSKLVAESGDCRIERITIPMFGKLSARGLLFSPKNPARHPVVIVCPDAGTWPEQFAGLSGDVKLTDWLTGLLGQGAAVYIPQSIERLRDHPYCKNTNKDRRWVLYRLGYVVGRTMPGMDVQDTIAAINYLSKRPDVDAARIGLMGIGQGGMTALYTAAVDRRAAATVVADYFQTRNRCWREPVDRRLCGQLLEFGDAELVGLIAPRPLSIVHWPGSATANESVLAEARRAARFYKGLKASDQFTQVSDLEGEDSVARAASLIADRLALTQAEGEVVWPAVRIPQDQASALRNRHFEERLKYLRELIDQSEAKRQDRWKLTSCPASDFPKIKAAMLEDYRKLVGEVQTEDTPINPRTELVLIADKYKAYRVMLDVAEGVEVYGNLLVPRAIRDRAVAVICQHGLTGTPEMVTGLGQSRDTPYHEFGRQLAERGYVVFAPLITHHYPYKRINDQARQADAVGMARVAMVVAKNRRVMDFLETIPCVDAGHIGYYGLSYGGYSAIWCAPLLDRLAATIISGHFNDRCAKLTSGADARSGHSFLIHPSEDHYHWNILHRFGHPEQIVMAAPRPVCIEFGQRDAITTPEWTAYAWEQMVAMRDHLGLTDRIELAHYDGTHEIHGVETFDFLDRFLRPERTVGRDADPLVEHVVDRRAESRVSGRFWIPAGAKQFRGMALRLSRVGKPGPLEIRFGSGPGDRDLGAASVPPQAVPSSSQSWHTLRVAPQSVDAGQLVYFEIACAGGATPSDHYVVFGPRPLGGKHWGTGFGLSYRVLTDRPQDTAPLR